MSNTEVVCERLNTDIAVLTKDVEELRRATNHTGNLAQSLWSSITGTLESGKSRLAREERILREKSKQRAKAAVDFARGNPWSAAGIVMGSLTVLSVLLWNELMK